MEHQSTKRVLRLPKEICNVFEERAVDMDLVLPDYVPEMAAILKVSLRPAVTSRYRSGDRYTVSGTVTVRLLYVTEDRTEPFCYEASQPFSVSFPLENAVHHNVLVKTDYVHARAASARRVDIHGAFRVYLKAFGVGEQAVFSPTGEKDIFCKEESCTVTLPFCEAEKAFYVNEQFDFQQPFERLICSDAAVIHKEMKAFVNKAILKGVLLIKAVGLVHGQCVTQYHEIPFSQIVDIDGVNESKVCAAEVGIAEQDLRVVQDESGNTSCSFDAKLFITVQCFDICSEQVISDVYSVDKPLLCETVTLTYVCRNSTADTKSDYRCTVETPEGMAGLVDIVGEVKSQSFDGKTRRICLAIGLIANDEHGALSYYERTVDLEDVSDCDGEFQILRMDASLQGDTIGIQIRAAISGFSESEQTLTPVTSTAADPQTSFVKSGAAIRIVYANEQENVWDIAKTHHACVQDIMAENNLTDLVIKHPTMLMIPML